MALEVSCWSIAKPSEMNGRRETAKLVNCILTVELEMILIKLTMMVDDDWKRRKILMLERSEVKKSKLDGIDDG